MNLRQRISRPVLTHCLVAAFLFSLSGSALSGGFDTLLVGIDPGHGGSDPGNSYHGLQEKDVNLTTALALSDWIRSEGADVFLTRNSDVDVDLRQRWQAFRDNLVEMSISVHYNAEASQTANYHSTWVAPDSCETNSGDLAEAIASRVEGIRDIGFSTDCSGRDGVKTAGFAMVTQPPKPAVLVETSFLSHPDEADFLEEENNRGCYGWGIYAGVADYQGDSPIDSGCGDKPIAYVDDFRIENEVAHWHSYEEIGTLCYRVLGTNDPDGLRWEIVSGEIPARGGGSEYAADLADGYRFYQLQEKEKRAPSFRWNDIEILEPGGGASNLPDSPGPYEPRPIHLIGLGKDRTEMERFVEDQNSHSVRADYEVVPRIDLGTVERVRAANRGGETLSLIWEGQRDGALQKRRRGPTPGAWLFSLLRPPSTPTARSMRMRPS